MRLIFISIILAVFLAACDQQSADKKNSKIQEEVVVDNLKTDSLSLSNNLNAFFLPGNVTF
jgi:PBP1b-binding outer membrane lipoprotein LpoB